MTSDARSIVAMLGAEVERMGWSEAARRSGMRRETLHRIFGKRSTCPNLRTIACVAEAVGVQLTALKLPTR